MSRTSKGIAQSLNYTCSKESMESGQGSPAGDTIRAAASGESHQTRKPLEPTR